MMYLSNVFFRSLILITTTIHSSLCVYPHSHYALQDTPHYHPDILLGQFYPPPPPPQEQEEEEEEEATYPPTYPQHFYLSHPFYSLYNSPPPPPGPGQGPSTTTSKPYRYLYPYTSYPHPNPSTTSSEDTSTPQSYHPYDPNSYNLPSSTESPTNGPGGNGTRKTVLSISSIIIPIQQSSNANGNGRGSNIESPGQANSNPNHNNNGGSSRSRSRGNDRNVENNNGENTNNREPSPFYIIVAQHNSDSDSDDNNDNNSSGQDQDQDQRAPAPGQQHYQHLPVAEPTRRSNENSRQPTQPNGSNNNGQTRNFSLTKYLLTRSNELDEPENDTPQENTQDFYPLRSHNSGRTHHRQNSGSSNNSSSSTGNKRRQFHSINFKHLPRYTPTTGTGTGTSTTTTTTTPSPYYHYTPRYYPVVPVPVPVPSPYNDRYEDPVGLPLLPPGPTPQHLVEPSTHYHHDLHRSLDEPNKGYYFSYNVQNPETNDFKSAEETREGQHVTGSYSLLQPDGIVRTVRYYADPYNGFNALVENSPAPNHHHPNQLDPSPPSSHLPKYNPSG